ncbi:tubulin monoglutamylase TTLL4-like isoform X2 [Salvelinus fontinalis]|uniref:tubulin monoglutamylase TTLL4-like isoform X2 n=1 Tax=Salvelinus fontinalis TaxID=8038 RepID=UPI0024862598|nr:tubulin monoglutamylase TTLL4-like isoform X2 [Salvelinus fontinalis]
MASNGAEDKLNTRASCSQSSNLIIRAKSAVFHTADSHTRPFSSHEKKTLQSCARVPQVTSDSIGQLNARVGQTQKNQLHTASGTPLQRAFNRSVPAATYLANKPQRAGSAGANLARGHSNGHCQPTVLSKSTQISSADIISYRHNPGVLEPTVNSYRHSLDSLKLRSRILARKRALSPQPAHYPTCPSPPKAERVPDAQNNAASQPAESTTTSMPTNQSVPWTSGKLRDNSKGFMRPTMGKVPSCSRQETTQTRDSAKLLSPQTKSASYCRRGDNGDGNTQTKFTHHPHNTVPLQDRSSHRQDVSLDQTWRLQDPHQFESPMAADTDGHSQRLGFCAAVHEAPRAPHNTSTERIRKVNSEVEFTEAVRKMTQSRSALTLHPRNGTVISFTTGTPGSNVDPVQLGKAMTNSPVISVSHSLAPAKPSVPLCLTMRDQPVFMETSSASGLDSNATTNSSSTTASMAPLPHAGITPTQSPTQASATASSTAGITPTQASATASSGVGITPTQSFTQASATASSTAGITPTQSLTQAPATASSGVGITPTQASATASSGVGITPTQSPTQVSATASSTAGITPTQSFTQATATASSGVGITPTQSPTQASATASSGVGITPTQSYTQASFTASSGVGITPTQSPTQASATASSGVGITPTQSYSQASATASSGVGITPTQSYSQASATASSGASSIPENTEMGSESASGSSQSQRPSVTSVTTQISAIHLTKERSVLSLQGGHSPSQSPPGLGEEQQPESPQLLSPQSVTMQEDGDRGEEDYPDDELENDCSGGDDDDEGSDCSSMNDASSTASIPVLPNITDEEVMSPELEVKPALIPSMFPLIPPTLYFSTANQRVESLPPEQRKLLKWKMSTVTPNIVKHTIARSHFKVTKKSHDWLGCWGHHMKSPGFKAIREYQKLNHFPGSFQIGRKDRLWRNLSKMQAQFGKREFSFFPRSFVLPQDIKLLRKAWEDSGSRQKWIIKPPASARGIGIQVIHKWSQMPCKRPLLVQKYLHKPYLISGNKFDLRIYVYVTSYDPLRVYIFQDGLVRFASCKYSSSMKSLGNKFMHLTNYSVNKKNSDYQSNDSDKACQGHKWALKALWHYLGCKGVNTTLIWEKIKDIVMKTIIASDPYVNTLVKLHLRSPYSCHELFGFDVMLDENLKPWVLEVNISPSLHSNTALDVAIKGQMIRDVLNLAGFLLPQREEVLPSGSSSASSLCGGTRERSRPEISTDEKVKRAFYLSQRFADQDFFSSILDVMTPEDVRVLAETEDELSRKGEFERVFPSHCSSRYLRFFKQPRYLNILLNQWETKYGQNRREGVRVLRSLCQKGVHLGTTDAAHLWSESTYVPKSDHLRQEPSRSSVVVTRPQPDQEEYCFSQEVTTSLPDISLLGSSASSPGLSLATESTASVPPRDEEFES